MIVTEVWEDNVGGITLVRQAEDGERIGYQVGVVSVHENLAGLLTDDLIWLAHDPEDCTLHSVEAPTSTPEPDTPYCIGEYVYAGGDGTITLHVGRMGNSGLAYAGLYEISNRLDLR